MSQQVIIQDNIYIPQEMFNYVVQTIKKSKKDIFKFSYEDLLQYSLEYDYQQANTFRMNLAKYAQRGSYYILFTQYFQNNYIQNLSTIMPINQIQALYKDMYSIMGITKYGFAAKDNTDKNCITVLNKSLLKLDDWIGTLQHQMTHFIQRVIGLDETIQKRYQEKIKKTDKNIHPQIMRYVEKLAKYTESDQSFVKSLIKKYSYMFAKNELQQTLKSVLLLFKNMYERQIIYNNGKIADIKIKDYSIKDRKIWLKQFLSTINSTQYLQSDQFKNALSIWKKKSILCNQEQLIKHRYISYILCYLGIKNILSQVDIDKKLEQYFEEF